VCVCVREREREREYVCVPIFFWNFAIWAKIPIHYSYRSSATERQPHRVDKSFIPVSFEDQENRQAAKFVLLSQILLPSPPLALSNLLRMHPGTGNEFASNAPRYWFWVDCKLSPP
jgi:hypothetical protein